MSYQVRKRTDRGYADHGWLKTYHTFSFSSYQDPDHMRFRSLRVMNEDWVAPGQGFGTHPHANMEIVTYVLEGALEHRDSMGNGEILRPGEFQRMSAGTGITHSEFNPSKTEPVHLYQIWLYPNQQNLTPSYEQKSFPPADQLNRFRIVASPDADQGSLTIHQDARIYLATLDGTTSLEQSVAPGRHAWLQVLRGKIQFEEQELEACDGVAISQQTLVQLSSSGSAEVMLFDLA